MSETCFTAARIEGANLADGRLSFEARPTRSRTGDFATALRLVNLIGEAADLA